MGGREGQSTWLQFVSPRVLVRSSLLTVTVSYENLQDLQTMSRLDGKALLNSIIPDGVTRYGHSIAQLIRAAENYVDNPKPREIVARCRFPHSDIFRTRTHFTYNTNTKVDLLPVLITQLDDVQKQLATTMVHRAPSLGGESYPAFNYALDTLYLFYGRCGWEEAEHDKYWQAIQFAIQTISKFAIDNTAIPPLRRIKVTFCPHMINEYGVDGSAFVCLFNVLPNLQNLELVPGDHCKHYFYDCGIDRSIFRSHDYYALSDDAKAISRKPYHFTVEMGQFLPGDYPGSDGDDDVTEADEAEDNRSAPLNDQDEDEESDECAKDNRSESLNDPEQE